MTAKAAHKDLQSKLAQLTEQIGALPEEGTRIPRALGGPELGQHREILRLLGQVALLLTGQQPVDEADD